MHIIIINSGQKGAETGALLAAKEKGIVTGGITSDKILSSSTLDLSSYGIQPYEDYSRVDTLKTNVDSANVTITFGKLITTVASTIGYCNYQRWNRATTPVPFPIAYKPAIAIQNLEYPNIAKKVAHLLQEISEYLFTNNLIIHITGAKEIKESGIEEKVKQIVIDILDIINNNDTSVDHTTTTFIKPKS